MNKIIALKNTEIDIERLYQEVLKYGQDIIPRKQVEKPKVELIPKSKRFRMILFNFESDVWVDYADILYRIDAEILALKFCMCEIREHEKDALVKHHLIVNLLEREWDFSILKIRACEFMKVGEN